METSGAQLVDPIVAFKIPHGLIEKSEESEDSSGSFAKLRF